MYGIVVGAGDTGSNLVELALQDGHDVVAIGTDGEKASDVSATDDCTVPNAAGRSTVVESDLAYSTSVGTGASSKISS